MATAAGTSSEGGATLEGEENTMDLSSSMWLSLLFRNQEEFIEFIQCGYFRDILFQHSTGF